MKALIIEDETAAAVNLQAVLKEIAPAVEVVATLESVVESIEWLRNHPMPRSGVCRHSFWPTVIRSGFSARWR